MTEQYVVCLSQDRADDVMILHRSIMTPGSYLESAAAHGVTALDAIRAAIEENPLATATPPP